SVGGAKTVTADTFLTLSDVVTFENLIPGEAYTLQGVLMNAETSSELLVNGNSVKETVTFIPDRADGTTEVVFWFDAEGLGGSSTVVFEKLFHNGKEIAKHEDLKDDNQRVSFKTPPVPPKDHPDTGDANDMVLPAAVMIAAGSVLMWMLIRRRRMKGKQ
ncbi:MAG: VaFE repeat-containing surface-anchored protein, partial [Parasporobacterium sp.]|nr:VaFE repeat-containing surface-anchored protein [Parasporobacterium sp.]